jgi:anti-anti-sigma factor
VKVKVDRKNANAVITLPVKSARESAGLLGKEIQLLLSGGVRRIVYDMARAEMIDSSTLGTLIHMRRKYPDSKVEMVILNARGYVRGLLENARFTALFKMVDA